ncbi:MAG: putative bifunctional diguanylate cyclase/phosphodiesterase [Kineosporiaceae bacterium]
MSVADPGPRRDRGVPRRVGPLPRSQVPVYLVSLGVGALFPLVLPLLGIPWSVIHLDVFVACALSSVLVAFGHAVVARRGMRRHLAGLAGGLEAVADVVRDATATGAPSGWAPGRLRALALPATQDDEVGRTVAAVNALIDALETEHAFRAIVDASGDLVVVLSDAARITFASESVSTSLGWPIQDFVGRPLASFVHAGDLVTFLSLTDGDWPGPQVSGEHERPRIRVRAVDDEWRDIEWTVSRRRDAQLGGVVLIGRDVTERIRMESELLHQATHDLLTGLPNRKALLALAAVAVAGATAAKPVSVLMLDLDRFKEVNDSLGHAVGDQLLAQVGPRLRVILRPSDVLARLGGDEFAVLLPGAGQAAARRVAERLSAQLDDPFVVDGMDLHVDASIGIAVSHADDAPADEERPPPTVEGLLREADVCMYRAKESGQGIALYDPERDGGQSRSRLELSAELRRAIVEDQLVLHYQPVVDVLEGRLAGVEALVRWQHPVRGLLSPGQFLDLAEQTGLVVPLSRVVLETAIAQAATWQRRGRPLTVAVNLSPRWLQLADVPDIVARMLVAHGIGPELLRLEITESVALNATGETLPMLQRLRDMGVGLSLDDFGTGYSSMTHLRQLPVDEMKVDQQFVQAMTSNPEDAVIVRAAVELGHNLGMTVVAEGIEDADTLAEVVASGCSLAQGYYFSRPLPADELLAFAEARFPLPADDRQHRIGAGVVPAPSPARDDARTGSTAEPA